MAENITVNRNAIEAAFREIQHEICEALSHEDGGASFVKDAWVREQGGGGLSRVLTNGNIIEKGGVNFSAVHGKMDPNIASELHMNAEEFFATGVSIVIHPHSPHVPIIHMNIRYFELNEDTWWFGGGIDLTPHWVVPDDAQWFQQQLQSVCDAFDSEYYSKFKKWADDYFFLPNRNETRGVGGIFFDRLNSTSYNQTKSQLFEFVCAVGRAFAPIYCHFMRKNHTIPITPQDMEWQKVRRSRYVEFNLIYDRGTTFGLKSNGRTESILMSLPPNTGWEYCRSYSDQEKQCLAHLQKGIDWVSYSE